MMVRRVLVAAAAVVLLGVLLAPAWAGDVYVQGYTGSDGDVRAAEFSVSAGFQVQELVYLPNVNPYTGHQGTNTPRLYDGNSNSLSGSGSYGLGGT